MCAKRLVNLGGVAKLFYANDYRLREGLDILRAAGVACAQYDHQANVINPAALRMDE